MMTANWVYVWVDGVYIKAGLKEGEGGGAGGDADLKLRLRSLTSGLAYDFD